MHLNNLFQYIKLGYTDELGGLEWIDRKDRTQNTELLLIHQAWGIILWCLWWVYWDQLLREVLLMYPCIYEWDHD